MGVALGVVFGAILQLIISLIGLIGLGFDYHFKIYWKNHGFKTVLHLLPARSLDQGIDYVNGIVTTNLSSRMGAGALRSFQQATALHQMPVNLVGTAISTAFFPKLTEELGEGKEDAYNKPVCLRNCCRCFFLLSLFFFFQFDFFSLNQKVTGMHLVCAKFCAGHRDTKMGRTKS